jgi:hypothetical protein
MTTIAATADTFVSLRRIFFIEVILFPAAISSLVTVANASEQGENTVRRLSSKPIGHLVFECSPRKFCTNIRYSRRPRNCTRAFLQSIIPEALLRQYAKEVLP